MIVGSLEARLLIREARSLKDKRRVVRSIRDRLKNAFNVSVAEVGSRDRHQVVELGFAVAAENAHDAKVVLGKIVEALRCHPTAELLEHHLEVW